MQHLYHFRYVREIQINDGPDNSTTSCPPIQHSVTFPTFLPSYSFSVLPALVPLPTSPPPSTPSTQSHLSLFPSFSFLLDPQHSIRSLIFFLPFSSFFFYPYHSLPSHNFSSFLFHLYHSLPSLTFFSFLFSNLSSFFFLFLPYFHLPSFCFILNFPFPFFFSFIPLS